MPVWVWRNSVQTHGTAPDGRLFSTERGNIVGYIIRRPWKVRSSAWRTRLTAPATHTPMLTDASDTTTSLKPVHGATRLAVAVAATAFAPSSSYAATASVASRARRPCEEGCRGGAPGRRRRSPEFRPLRTGLRRRGRAAFSTAACASDADRRRAVAPAVGSVAPGEAAVYCTGATGLPTLSLHPRRRSLVPPLGAGLDESGRLRSPPGGEIVGGLLWLPSTN